MEENDSELYLIHIGERDQHTEQLMRELVGKSGLEENSLNIIWRTGEPTKAITDACHQFNLDLLIAGALTRESTLKYYMGSVARNIMREAPCSVLIITQLSGEPGHFRKIYASAHYNNVGEEAIRTGYEFAKLENAENFVVIKEIQTPALAATISDGTSLDEIERKKIELQSEEENKLHFFLRELNLSGIPISTICLYGKEGWETVNYIRNNKGDLLVVPAPPRRLKLFDRLFQHDIEFVFKQLPCSLLIIKERE